MLPGISRTIITVNQRTTTTRYSCMSSAKNMARTSEGTITIHHSQILVLSSKITWFAKFVV
jgi:hypothetical protein